MAKRKISGLSIADAIKDLEHKQQATLACLPEDEQADAAPAAADEGAELAPQAGITAPAGADGGAELSPQAGITAPAGADGGAELPRQAGITAPAGADGGAELPPQASVAAPAGADGGAAPERKKAAASSTTGSAGVSVRVVVEKILGKEVRYKNARSKPVIISEEYRNCIGLLSELSECEVSQIVNNMLSLYFDNPEIKELLNAFAKTRYRRKVEILMR